MAVNSASLQLNPIQAFTNDLKNRTDNTKSGVDKIMERRRQEVRGETNPLEVDPIQARIDAVKDGPGQSIDIQA